MKTKSQFFVNDNHISFNQSMILFLFHTIFPFLFHNFFYLNSPFLLCFFKNYSPFSLSDEQPSSQILPLLSAKFKKRSQKKIKNCNRFQLR